MMERIWLKSYLPGMATDIDPDALRSLKQMAEQSFQKFPERSAYIQMGRHLTYRQLDRMSRDIAAWLQNVAGLKPGDRLAIMLPNVLQYPIAMFAALRAGLTVVNTNPLYTAPELEHQLKDAGCVAIVVLENFAHVLEAVLPRTAVRHVITTSVGELCRKPDPQASSRLEHRGRREFQRGTGRGPKSIVSGRRYHARGHRVSAIHRWHHGSGQGRGPHAWQHLRQPAAGLGVD